MSIHQTHSLNMKQRPPTNFISPHVLFIDDNRADNFLIELLIKLDNVPVIPHFMGNAIDGLKYLHRLRGLPEFPRYIFVDINMPLKDGFEFVEDFTKEFPEYHSFTKIYILSTSMRTYDRERAKNYNTIQSYIEKPLESLKLYTIIQNDKHGQIINI